MALDTEFWDGEFTRLIALKSRTDGTTLREWRFNARKSGSTDPNITTMPADSWQGVRFQAVVNVSHRATRATAAGGWHHLVYRFQTTSPSVSIAVDGTVSTSSDGPNGSPSGDGTGPLFIARWDQETATAWRGRLALIAFYDYGLSDSQHGAHLAAATNIVDYSAAVMTDSPVAFWRMQDATGDLADYTGNGHTAVLDAGSPLYQQEGPFTGARSVITDGSAGWKVPDDPAWSATEFTIEAWVWAGPPDPAPVRRGRRGLGLVRGPRSAL